MGPGTLTLVAPSWLQTNILIGNGFHEIKVKPLHVANFSPGVYEGIITITINSVQYEVTVVFTVFENIQTGFSLSELNFTDDYDTISTFYETSEYKVKLQLDAKYF